MVSETQKDSAIVRHELRDAVDLQFEKNSGKKIEERFRVTEEEYEQAKKEARTFVSMLRFEVGEDKESGATIYFNDDLSEPREYFALAHELGHYLMHGFKREPLPDDEKLDGPTRERWYGVLEVEADCFANHILIVDKEFDKYKKDIRDALQVGDRQRLENVKAKIYTFYKELTIKRLPPIPSISRRAEVALRLRILRLVWAIEEEMTILSEECDFNLADLDIKSSKDPYIHYADLKKREILQESK